MSIISQYLIYYSLTEVHWERYLVQHYPDIGTFQCFLYYVLQIYYSGIVLSKHSTFPCVALNPFRVLTYYISAYLSVGFV